MSVATAVNRVKDCEVCGKSFRVRDIRYSRTCGRQCGAKLRGKLNFTLTPCIQCGEPHAKRRMNSGRCVACQSRISLTSVRRIRSAVDKYLERLSKNCTICGKQYLGFWMHHCETCTKKIKRDRSRASKQDSGGSHRKRCRRFGAQYDPTVRVSAVVKRDGTRCHWCKCETLKTEEYHPQQRTLDHVIPISKGGSHTMQNVVIACQQCNSKKGNKVKSIC